LVVEVVVEVLEGQLTSILADFFVAKLPTVVPGHPVVAVQLGDRVAF